jgi:carbamoyltransferase
MGYFLGISAYYHDSAAAIVRNGEVIAAAQEERFSRQKHDSRFPHHAIAYCLGEAFIEPSDLEGVIFQDDPILYLDRFFANAIAVAPRGRDRFISGCQTRFGEKSRLARDVEACLGEVPPLLAAGHHKAHAASAFYPSPFQDAAILTLDGVGEWATCTVGVGRGNDIEILKEIRYPHSIGFLYSAFTQFCGFKVNSGEYKLMGLAPYGEPRYADIIRRELIDIREDGSFRLNTEAFGFMDSRRMISPAFERLFGGPARTPEARFTRREMDLAASVQLVAEEVILGLARHAKSLTGSSNLVMAGGVALNCVANGKIRRQLDFDGLFVQPAADDAGGALGAALLASHTIGGATRSTAAQRDGMKGARLGPGFSSYEIDASLARFDARAHAVPDPEARARQVAKALAEGKIVGYFSGRMEFGPRALGGRSIIGDPRRQDMQRRMNLKIKYRESFRPFAPIVLEEHCAEYFELEGESPYMLLVAPVRQERRLQMAIGPSDTDDALVIVDQPRSDIPAVTHVDYSARIQTVDAERSPDLYRLLKAFRVETDCPVLVNTSFNVRGEPIVCTPYDAYRCFMLTDIDVLVLEDRILFKEEQPAFTDPTPGMDPSMEDMELPAPEANASPRIDPPVSERIADELLDGVIAPLADARRRTGQPMPLPTGPDSARVSYFEPVMAHAIGSDLRYPGGGMPNGLIDELERYWAAHGKPELAAITPRLKELAQAIEDAEQRSDGKVDIFVYTMF